MHVSHCIPLLPLTRDEKECRRIREDEKVPWQEEDSKAYANLIALQQNPHGLLEENW